MLSVDPYRLPSGRVSYERMSRDLATKLELKERELDVVEKRWADMCSAAAGYMRERDEVPKPVRIICRIICRMIRGRG